MRYLHHGQNEENSYYARIGVHTRYHVPLIIRPVLRKNSKWFLVLNYHHKKTSSQDVRQGPKYGSELTCNTKCRIHILACHLLIRHHLLDVSIL